MEFAKKPRSAEFQRRLEAAIALRKVENTPPRKRIPLADHSPGDSDIYREEHAYDPEILSEEDIAWSKVFYAVALRDYDNTIRRYVKPTTIL